MKKCSVCKQEKEDNKFHHKANGKLRPNCKVCQSVYTKRHYADNKPYYKTKAALHKANTSIVVRRHIMDYLLSHPCIDCGETDPVILEFDHVRGKKSMEISLMASGSNGSLASLIKEIEKCVVRCANCHGKKTARERGYWKYIMSLPLSSTGLRHFATNEEKVVQLN